MMKWIVNYILEDNEKDVPMMLFVSAEGIGPAMDLADDIFDKEYPDRHIIVHSVRLAADQDMPHGHIAEDPVGLEDEDIKRLAWWRKQ
jgi:hypothetical protein